MDDNGRPLNPRGDVFETTDLQASIKETGLKHPIMVRIDDHGRYLLQEGHRRLAACKKLGWQEIPCLIENYSPEANPLDDIITMFAGDVTSDYNPVSAAIAVKRLVDAGYRLSQIAKAWGKKPDTVGAYLALLDASPAAADAVESGRMGISVFSRLKSLPPEIQEAVIDRASDDSGNVSMRNVIAALKETKAEAEAAAVGAVYIQANHNLKNLYNAALQAVAHIEDELAEMVAQYLLDYGPETDPAEFYKSLPADVRYLQLKLAHTTAGLLTAAPDGSQDNGREPSVLDLYKVED